MTRKKVYTYLALLFCIPTALFCSSRSDNYTIVGIQGEDKGDDNKAKLDAVFASTEVTVNTLYDTLNKQNSYKGKIKKLILYINKNDVHDVTTGDKEKDLVIWTEEYEKNTDTDQSKIDEKKRTYTERKKEKLSKIAQERDGFRFSYKKGDVEGARQAWFNERKQEGIDLESIKNKFENVHGDTDKKNIDILIIDEKGGLQKKEKYRKEPLVIVTSTGGQTITLEEVTGDDTVGDIKSKIQEQENLLPGQQTLVYQNKTKLEEDERKLSQYGVEPEKGKITKLNLLVGNILSGNNASPTNGQPGQGTGNKDKQGNKDKKDEDGPPETKPSDGAIPKYQNPRWIFGTLVVFTLVGCVVVKGRTKKIKRRGRKNQKT